MQNEKEKVFSKMMDMLLEREGEEKTSVLITVSTRDVDLYIPFSSIALNYDNTTKDGFIAVTRDIDDMSLCLRNIRNIFNRIREITEYEEIDGIGFNIIMLDDYVEEINILFL